MNIRSMLIACSFVLTILTFSCSEKSEKVVEESKKVVFDYPYGDGFSEPDLKNATKKTIEGLISQANSEIQGIPLGYEWRFTRDHIKSAIDLLKKGELNKSYIEASKSIFEIDSAIQQSRISSKLWKSVVIK